MLHYFTEQDVYDIADKLTKVLKRNKIKPSDEHIEAIITFGDNHFYELEYIRIYNQESTLRVEQFIDNFNEILDREDDEFVITFTKKKKKNLLPNEVDKDKNWSVIFDHKLITDWIVKTLKGAIAVRSIPLAIGPQLFDTYLTGRVSDKKYTIYQKKIKGNIYERKKQDEIITESITTFCFPLLEYLNLNTTLKTKGNQLWTLAQLGFVIEVLIALGFYTSQGGKEFIFGTSKPTVGDKKYLQTTLQNKIKQGFVNVKSGTHSPVS